MGAGVRHFCTLFDSKYLPQGIALYESLVRHSSEPFTLHVLTMDHDCYMTLRQMRLPHVELITLHSFEWDMGLMEARQSRTWQEFCWSCASNLCDYLMPEVKAVHYPDLPKPSLPEVTYLDADCWFAADPAPVFESIGARSIAITPHQFPENSEKPRLTKSGLFNVGFVHFKNTPPGKACLSRWAAQVRDRCSVDVGCGDQLYLDSWPADFGDEVCILGVGVNAGPWNLMAYDVTERDGYIYLGADRLVCFHFHEFSFGHRLTNYPLRESDIHIIYDPYVTSIRAAQARIESVRQPA